MQKGQALQKLLRSPRTVFTTADVALLWGEAPSAKLRARLHYHVQSGALIRIRRGLFAKDQNYDRVEMATCLYRPSYISFETVLWHEGLILCMSPYIHVASYLSRQLECGGRTIRFHKVRRILLNKTYLLDRSRVYPMATPERALLDALRRDRNFRFIGLDHVSREEVYRHLHLYRNRRLELQVEFMLWGRY